MAALKHHGWRSDSGAEIIEFALTFPLLLLVVLGIFDFGLLFQQYLVITNAAREGARIVVLPDYQVADARTRAQQYLDASLVASGGTATVDVLGPDAVAIGENCMTTYTVRVSYPHQFLFVGGIGRFFGTTFGTKTLTATATMRTEVVAGSCGP